MQYLNAVFWDYPQFTNEEYLKNFIQENNNSDMYLWILKRFLEYGRVVDVINYFKIKEISELLPKLTLSNYTIKKWKRLIEIYESRDRE